MIEDEFSVAVGSLTPERLSELIAACVPDAVISTLVVGVSPIETYCSGFYEPRDKGPPAVLVPCGIWGGLNWHLDDLCAFYLDKPERWWLRLGVGVLLGDIYRTSLSPRRIYQTPLQWLQGGATGFCVLDWATDPLDLFLGAGHVVADPPLLKKMRKASVKAAMARFDGVFTHA